MADKSVTVSISSDSDIVSARQQGRRLTAELGFSTTEQAIVATAISELARNILEYARRGKIALSVAEADGRQGVCVVAKDDGPGIADVELALRDGFSTGKSLGLGLPGTKRLMDEFHIVSRPGKGTVVTVKKWRR